MNKEHKFCANILKELYSYEFGFFALANHNYLASEHNSGINKNKLVVYQSELAAVAYLCMNVNN